MVSITQSCWGQYSYNSKASHDCALKMYHQMLQWISTLTAFKTLLGFNEWCCHDGDQHPWHQWMSVSVLYEEIEIIRLSKGQFWPAGRQFPTAAVVYPRLRRNVQLGPQTEETLSHPHWLLQSAGPLFITFLLILNVSCVQIPPNSKLPIPRPVTMNIISVKPIRWTVCKSGSFFHIGFVVFICQGL